MIQSESEALLGDDIASPIGWQIRQGVTDEIRELSLTGLPSDRVFHRRLPLVRPEEKLPAIIVSKTRGQFGVAGTTNTRNQNNYGVVVLIVRAASRVTDAEAMEGQQLEFWFEEIANHFLGKRPQFTVRGACSAGPIAVVDTDPMLAARWVQQMDAAYLNLRVPMRVER